MTARQARRKNVVICLAGMTACGKSTASCQTADTEISAEIRLRRNGSEGVSPQVGILIAGKRLMGNNRDIDPRFDKQVDAELLSGIFN